MARWTLAAILLAGLAVATVGSYWQARRSDTVSQPGWAEYTGQPERIVGTPLLSVRRVPGWLAAPVSQARLASAFSTVLTQPETPERTCLVVYRNDQLVVDERGDELLIPAALMKIVTAAAVLAQAEPTYRYTTKVFVRSDALESTANGVLTGDLYLVGGGDPVLSTPGYVERYTEVRAHTDITSLAEETAAALSKGGITTIRGGVIADESRYPEEERDYTGMRPHEGASPIWKESFVTHNQVGPLSALILDDGYSSYAPNASSAGQRQNIRTADPARHAAEVFDDLLEERDFVIRSRTGKGIAPPEGERTLLAEVESPPLSEIVTRMLRYSDNTTAEMLFKEVGWLADIGSARALAFFVVYDVLLRLLDLPTELTDGVAISDGSGLSSHNRLTCRIVAESLRQAGPDSPLVEGLAIVGESGTLSNCRIDGSTAGMQNSISGWEPSEVRAKNGALNDVSALAGITVADNGDVLTFAMIANDENVSASLGFCNILQRTLMTAALGHPYGPAADAAALLPRPVVLTDPIEPRSRRPGNRLGGFSERFGLRHQPLMSGLLPQFRICIFAVNVIAP